MSHEENLAQLAETSLKMWNEMLKSALVSGTLTDEMRNSDNFLLAKAIVDIWCQKRVFTPLSSVTKRETDNLSHFI